LTVKIFVSTRNLKFLMAVIGLRIKEEIAIDLKIVLPYNSVHCRRRIKNEAAMAR